MEVLPEHIVAVVGYIMGAARVWDRLDMLQKVRWAEVYAGDYEAYVKVAMDLQSIGIASIGADESVSEAVNRILARRLCPVFSWCRRANCDGVAYCKDYNLGGSHSFDGRGFPIWKRYKPWEHAVEILKRQGIEARVCSCVEEKPQRECRECYGKGFIVIEQK